MQFLAYPENRQTIVERLADGQRWVIPNEGRAVSFSPDSAQVTWTAGQAGPPFDSARREVWVSQVNGEGARQVITLAGGGFAGWLPDGRMLISVRLQAPESGQAFWVVSADGNSTTELARAYRLRGSLLSPGGDWLAYASAFDPDPALNGLWLIHTATGERFRLDKFGSFRWRDAQRLLVIPLIDNGAPAQLWEYDTRRTQEERSRGTPLTDPALTPLTIANGDWTVSPDGRQLVFVSAVDRNLWVLGLPGNR
jgi:Tol biopolymer transport system component